MKKSFFVAAIAAISLVACNKTETVETAAASDSADTMVMDSAAGVIDSAAAVIDSAAAVTPEGAAASTTTVDAVEGAADAAKDATK